MSISLSINPGSIQVQKTWVHPHSWSCPHLSWTRCPPWRKSAAIHPPLKPHRLPFSPSWSSVHLCPVMSVTTWILLVMVKQQNLTMGWICPRLRSCQPWTLQGDSLIFHALKWQLLLVLLPSRLTSLLSLHAPLYCLFCFYLAWRWHYQYHIMTLWHCCHDVLDLSFLF